MTPKKQRRSEGRFALTLWMYLDEFLLETPKMALWRRQRDPNKQGVCIEVVDYARIRLECGWGPGIHRCRRRHKKDRARDSSWNLETSRAFRNPKGVVCAQINLKEHLLPFYGHHNVHYVFDDKLELDQFYSTNTVRLNLQWNRISGVRDNDLE